MRLIRYLAAPTPTLAILPCFVSSMIPLKNNNGISLGLAITEGRLLGAYFHPIREAVPNYWTVKG
jgi:hypothetical protein